MNYPNPFNATTVIPFHVDGDAGRARPVTLQIVDVTGRRVRTLVQRPLTPGPHTRVWDGTDDGGRAVASGIYLSHLRVGGRQGGGRHRDELSPLPFQPR